MRRRNAWLALGCGMLMVCAGSRAGAVSLSLETATPDVAVGDSVVVAVVVSGLIAGRAPSLGSLDLDVAFNVSVLGYQDATFSLLLGDPALGEAVTASGLVPAGVDLFELSFLDPAELDALQPDEFAIAALAFSADAAGLALPLDEVGSLTIRVPEPGCVPLWLLAILCPALAMGFAGAQRAPAASRPR